MTNHPVISRVRLHDGAALVASLHGSRVVYFVELDGTTTYVQAVDAAILSCMARDARAVR